MTKTTHTKITPISKKTLQNRLSLNERLGLISLIDEGIREGSPRTPLIADLFSDLWDLVSATVSGSKIDRLKPEDSRNGFRVFKINAESGENLGRLNMIYLKKPLPCYYLTYVEVAPPFRKKGLGNRILEYFRDFLIQQSAVGILDNIIPKDDPTYDIYLKQAWEPIEDFIGSDSERYENYMVYIPPRLYGKNLREPLLRLIHHIRRKRTAIDMRENEVMVQRTISEFKELYSALLTYFEPEINRGGADQLMRFMFTRFTTKLIAFRQRISDLIGYTGGESMEQIVLAPEIACLPIQSYAPYDPADGNYLISGNNELCLRLSGILKKHPSRIIESLPDYGRPSLISWLKKRGIENDYKLTIGDLMDLGFDPTRLKEIYIDGEEYIFERIQERQLPELEKKKRLLRLLKQKISGLRVKESHLLINPPILVIRDRGNAYILRCKISGIHMEEALEQIQTSSTLKSMNKSLNLNRLILTTVKAAIDAIAEQRVIQKEDVRDLLTFFVSWDLKRNYPKMVVDSKNTSIESIWIA
jgi:GNAT superfamily N-acetyltransferase